MLKTLSLSGFLLCLLLAGCSSNPPKKNFFSETETAELKEILDRHMTEADWQELQEKFNRFYQRTGQKDVIDIRNECVTDPWFLMGLGESSFDKPEMQDELTNVIMRKVRKLSNK